MATIKSSRTFGIEKLDSFLSELEKIAEDHKMAITNFRVDSDPGARARLSFEAITISTFGATEED